MVTIVRFAHTKNNPIYNILNINHITKFNITKKITTTKNNKLQKKIFF